MYNLVKRILTIFFAVLLIFLFTAPSFYLARLAKRMDIQCASALNMLKEGADPAHQLVGIRNAFDESADTLRLFLDHAVVDTVAAAVHGLVPLDDPADIESGLEALRAELEQLAAIERVDLHTIF